MTNEYKSQIDSNEPTVYQIRIKGHLGQQRMDWFEGLNVTLEKDGNTLLRGSVVDQSALYGILKRIRDLGLPLLSVSSINSSQVAIAGNDKGKGEL